MKKSLLLLLAVLLAWPSLAGAAGRPGRPVAGKAAFEKIRRARLRSARAGSGPAPPAGAPSRVVAPGARRERRRVRSSGPGRPGPARRDRAPPRGHARARRSAGRAGERRVPGPRRHLGLPRRLPRPIAVPTPPCRSSSPSNGVDVWGIDLRWTRVPAEQTDFAFMEDWGIEHDARDLGVGAGRGARDPPVDRQRHRPHAPARLEPRRPDRLRLPERREPAARRAAPGRRASSRSTST